MVGPSNALLSRSHVSMSCHKGDGLSSNLSSPYVRLPFPPRSQAGGRNISPLNFSATPTTGLRSALSGILCTPMKHIGIESFISTPIIIEQHGIALWMVMIVVHPAVENVFAKGHGFSSCDHFSTPNTAMRFSAFHLLLKQHVHGFISL